jgi:hypothetical protein
MLLMERRHAAPLLALLLILGLTTGAPARDRDAIQRLLTEILASPSATQALTAHCARLGLARPPVIRAVRDRSVDHKADGNIRRLLHVKTDEPVRYRRVRLSCGDEVLSDADNWYVPARLTAEMNNVLDHTDTSFGTVVKPLGFRRRTLGTEDLHDGRHVLRVRALLVTAQGLPFSLVQENYSAILVRHPQ